MDFPNNWQPISREELPMNRCNVCLLPIEKDDPKSPWTHVSPRDAMRCPSKEGPKDWRKPISKEEFLAMSPEWPKMSWEAMAGSIIDTVHLTNEDYVNEKLVDQLKRYFMPHAGQSFEEPKQVESGEELPLDMKEAGFEMFIAERYKVCEEWGIDTSSPISGPGMQAIDAEVNERTRTQLVYSLKEVERLKGLLRDCGR